MNFYNKVCVKIIERLDWKLAKNNLDVFWINISLAIYTSVTCLLQKLKVQSVLRQSLVLIMVTIRKLLQEYGHVTTW